MNGVILGVDDEKYQEIVLQKMLELDFPDYEIKIEPDFSTFMETY